MSGIAAILNVDGQPGDPTALMPLERALAFLGKDMDSHHAGPFQCLRVRSTVGRTAALEVSARGVCLAGTSRLDGRKELEAALAPVCGDCTRATDAALIIHAYERWGAGLVDHVIGDFGFVLWDARAQRLIAATDQFGVRPMFYARVGQHLIVSNAMAAIRDSGLVDTGLDDDVVGDTLTIGFGTDPHATIHSAIRRIPSGHRLRWCDGAFHVERYWSTPAGNRPILHRSVGDYADQFREVFFRAAADRVPARGSIGILMSGGVDSTSVAAAVKDAIGAEPASRRMTAYTTVFRDFPEEEGHYAASAANALGIDSRVLVAEDFLLKAFPDHPSHLPSEPLSIPGMTPLSAAAETIASAGGTVFSGHGGDLLFAAAGSSWTGSIRSSGWRAPLTLAKYVGLFHRMPRTGLRSAISRRIGGRPSVVPLWIDAGFARRTCLVERIAHYHAAFRAPGLHRFADPFWSRILTMGDPGGTGLSMEQAHPFFDTRLLDLISRVPEPLLSGKRLLRDAMTSRLPPEILRRVKTPLGHSTLATRRHPAVIERCDALLERVAQVSEFVDVGTLRRCLARPTAETAHALAWAELFAYWLEGTLARDGNTSIVRL